MPINFILRSAQWRITVFILFISISSNLAIRNGLNGIYFRVSAHHILTHVNGTFSYTGSTPNVIRWIAEKFNMKFDWVPVSESEEAKCGSVQAGLNQLINKEVDISTLTTVPHYTRTEYMDFTYPVAIQAFHLMVPKPGEESRLFAPIRPFQYPVWVLMFLSLLSAVTLFTFFVWCNSRWRFFSPIHHRSNNKGIQSLIWHFTVYTLSIYTSQGGSFNYKQHSIRILAALWLLAATVLVNIYSGTLTSSLTITKFKRTVNSLEDLAASDELIMSLNVNSVMAQNIFQKGTSNVFNAIAGNIQRRPDSTYLTPEEGLEKLFSLKYAFPSVISYTSYLLSIDLNNTGKCRLQVSDRIPITQFYTFTFQKGNKFNQLFSEKIQFLWETGLMDHWIKNNLPLTELVKVEKCLVKQKNSVRQKPIKLVDLTSAFFVLGVGSSLAMISFFLENFRFI